jgi:2-polyprenyl-6-methoxyphenol hydroxylase-like FAD-dependent oxidoreductase
MDGLHSPFRFVLMLPQSETERLLEAHLESLGVMVERETELVDFSDSGDAVACTLRHAGGAEESLRAAWLVGCDGAHSVVRHRLLLPFEGDTIAAKFLLCDVHVANLPLADNELGIYWHEQGLVVFFPIGPQRYRIVADVGAAANRSSAAPTLDEIQAIVDHRAVAGIVLSDPVWLSAFAINERKVPHYRVGRVFVAGDAAHVHSPAGGQGMNTGMQDAFNLAWKLALVASGVSSASMLLESYSAERSPVAERVLADSGRMTRVAMARGHLVQGLRNFAVHHLLGLEPVRQAFVDQLSETTVAYRSSPLNGSAGSRLKGPGPGERLVDGRPFGTGSAPRFSLMASDRQMAARLIAAHPALLEPEPRDPPDAGGIWLVRPDGYVAASAGANDWTAISTHLERLTG